jgi:protein-S-isoprenylcysteine O-methyltransferase Ste14
MPAVVRDSMILRVGLPCYFVLYMFMGSTFNVIRLRRKYGIEADLVRQAHPVMRTLEGFRNLIFGAILVMVSLFAIDPARLARFAPIPYLDADGVRLAGCGLLLGSFGIVRVSQSHLGRSWRIGFDLAAPPPDLVTHGVYARSRNPIYAGMVATACGLFLVLPNALSFSIAIVTVALLQIRIRLEEEYLMRAHGEAFAEYCRRTPRWLFGHGRVPGS